MAGSAAVRGTRDEHSPALEPGAQHADERLLGCKADSCVRGQQQVQVQLDCK